MAAEDAPILLNGQIADLQNFGFDGSPGYKLDLGDGQFIITQQLDNGLTLAWSSDQQPEEAIGHAIPEPSDGVDAIVMYGDGDQQMTLCPEGAEILDTLRTSDGVWYVKLRTAQAEDYAIYVGPEGDKLSEMAVLGPTFNKDAAPLFLDPLELMIATGTPDVRLMGAYVMEKLIPRIDPQA